MSNNSTSITALERTAAEATVGFEYDARLVISNNVTFWQVQTQTSLCSLSLSLETPNDAQS